MRFGQWAMALAPTDLSVPDPDLFAELQKIVPADRVLTRAIDRIAFASDASFYRLVPKAVVLARSIDEVRQLFRLSRARHVPLTFRASGTSLSGQSLSDGLLVEVARHWRHAQVEERGTRVRTQPGVIGDQVNALLRPFGVKIGPDPASIRACTIGGILANNSSGMCCGVEQNSYHTVRSLTFVLPSGTCIDTGHPDADHQLRAAEPALHQGLLELRAQVLSQPELLGRIRAKYRMKNTTGYSLNALVDYQLPVDVFAHLLIGSEGTLAFIAEAVLDTVPVLPFKSTGLLFFPDIHAACAAIGPFRDAGARALELMDSASLRAAAGKPGMPAGVEKLPAGAAALLCEFQAADENELPHMVAAAENVAASLPLLFPPGFSEDARLQEQYWHVREGLFPTVGGVRQSGTTVIIEDVCFPIDHLAEAAVDLQGLFQKHRYDNAIIFGHAKDGNLHFVITQSFNDQAAIDQYAAFIDELVPLVVKKHGGALKAEHGTGRNMAPFVETEWGPEALAIMRRLKLLVDPEGLLNPGVILSSDARGHLRDLKSLPSIEAEADMCIECGYCEPVCPSRELTLTPRQRIVVRREMVRQEASASRSSDAETLEGDYVYSGLETCAGDGMCQTRCPVSIDTGALVKRFRAERHSRAANWMAHSAARNAGAVEFFARSAVAAGHGMAAVVGTSSMRAVTRAARAFFGKEWIPEWSADVPHPARPLPRTSSPGAGAIYFPACMVRMFGRIDGEPDQPSAPEALVALAQRAGLPVHIPDDIAGTCCSTPWHSKGFRAGDKEMSNRTVERLWRWTDGGRLGVVVEGSSCTHGIRTSRALLTPDNQTRLDALRVFDSVEYVHDELLPKLTVTRRLGSVCVHPVCAVVEMQLTSKLHAVCRAMAEEAVIPTHSGCCGFAGDRGMLHPELTSSATREEAAEVNSRHFDAYLTSNHPCAIGLHRATNKPWRAFSTLLEELTRTP
jgi:D-lactate dehydrogenase